MPDYKENLDCIHRFANTVPEGKRHASPSATGLNDELIWARRGVEEETVDEGWRGEVDHFVGVDNVRGAV